jgi:mono/diheme cytochrome c family protein
VAKRKPTSRPRADRAPQAARRPPRPAQKRPAPTPRGASPRQGPGALARVAATVRRFGFLIVLVIAVGGGIALGLRQGTDQNSEGFGETTTDQATQAPFQSGQEVAKGTPVREVFAHSCGTCHTLSRAGVKGIIGPDLDRSVLTAGKVRQMIRTGSLDTTMPKNLLVGKDAERVARYVARLSLASRRARESR